MNFVTDIGDAGLATVDTAFDVLALITTCSMGDSYCSQAKSDYAKANATIAANLDALFISGQAWTEIGKMLNSANNGDQIAQENTVALMAAILSPSKLVSGKIVNGVTKVEELVSNTNKLNKVENAIANESKVVSQAEKELANAEKGTKLELDPNKFDYLYGKASSGTHNADRSTQLVQAMRRLGLETNESGTKVLTEHLNKVVNTKGNVVDTYAKGSQKFEIRESLLIGPSGKATKLETSFEIMSDGSRRFVTTIPKEGEK